MRAIAAPFRDAFCSDANASAWSRFGRDATGQQVFAVVWLSLLLLLPWHQAQADVCRAPSLSTYERAKCEMKNEEVARAEMQNSLDRAVKAAEAMHKIWNIDFVSEIMRAQQLWIQWTEAECEMESDAIMGSAGAFEVHICRRKLDEAREHSLDDLIIQLESFAR